MLSRATWQAKAGNEVSGTYPEIRCYLEDVKSAIEPPDLVFQSTRDDRSLIFYRLRAGRGDFAGENLVIVARYMQQASGRQGYVSTIYLSRAGYSQGALFWPRRENASGNRCFLR